MRKLVLCFIICFFFAYSMCSQNIRTNSVGKKELVFFNDGILFIPFDSAYVNCPRNFCEEFSGIFLINGLALEDEQFLSLRLKDKFIIQEPDENQNQYLSSKHGYFYGICNTNDSCISNFVYVLNLNLKFVMNGQEISADQQKMVFENIKPENIKSIKRKAPLLKETYIELITY